MQGEIEELKKEIQSLKTSFAVAFYGSWVAIAIIVFLSRGN